MRKLAILLIAGISGIAAQSSARTPAQAPAAPASKPKTAGAPKTGATATARAAYDRALLRPALLKDKAPDTFQVKFVTTRGEFTVTVTRAWAPIGADRFYNLVKHHFYDNGSFFRVVPGFVVQFGLSAYAPVSAAWQPAVLKDDPVVQSNKRGYLTFATGGPGTRTTQVFINLSDNLRLDTEPSGPFAPFGKVDGDGMKVVDMFYDQYGDSTPRDYQDRVTKEGKAYLDKNWPKLDSIKTATLVGGAGETAPAKRAAPKSKTPAATKPQ